MSRADPTADALTPAAVAAQAAECVALQRELQRAVARDAAELAQLAAAAAPAAQLAKRERAQAAARDALHARVAALEEVVSPFLRAPTLVDVAGVLCSARGGFAADAWPVGSLCRATRADALLWGGVRGCALLAAARARSRETLAYSSADGAGGRSGAQVLEARGTTQLIRAAARGDAAEATALLGLGAARDAVDADGSSALAWAQLRSRETRRSPLRPGPAGRRL